MVEESAYYAITGREADVLPRAMEPRAMFNIFIQDKNIPGKIKLRVCT
jgi:hypothetical protein